MTPLVPEPDTGVSISASRVCASLNRSTEEPPVSLICFSNEAACELKTDPSPAFFF